MIIGNKTIILGNEYDLELIKRLKNVLGDMAPEIKGKIEGIGGSQELVEYRIEIKGEEVVISIETYIGVSVSGPFNLVDRIHDNVRERC